MDDTNYVSKVRGAGVGISIMGHEEDGLRTWRESNLKFVQYGSFVYV